MAARPTKGNRQVGMELPPEVIDRTKALARANGRTFRDEVLHALERHLAAPPTVEIKVPPLLPQE